MNSISIGTDIVDVYRFKKIAPSKKMKFYEKIFDKDEIKYCLKFKDPFPYFAGKFALKEAFLKAINQHIPLNMIHTIHEKTGRPSIVCSKISCKGISVSLSHEKKFAIAVVIVIW